MRQISAYIKIHFAKMLWQSIGIEFELFAFSLLTKKNSLGCSLLILLLITNLMVKRKKVVLKHSHWHNLGGTVTICT